ncbi:MAG: GNAT family N-acetyltransferase [Actinomycetota bacterium]|nr:GNAT family N-acetyltransferase [Actinomycetota bacterium]
MAATDVTVREVRGTVEVDNPDLRASVDVFNAVMHDLMGQDELSATYEEAARLWLPTPYARELRFVAEVDGTIVGRGYAGLPLSEEPEKAFVNVWVHPMHRRRGVGTALLRGIGRATRNAGRTRLHAWALSSGGSGRPEVAARTGVGSVPADDPGVRFAAANGFILQQVERMSRLDVSAERGRLRPVLDAAEEVAAPTYRTVAWRGFAPEERLEDLAWIWSRMSTDAPHGDIAVEEQVWDADRVVSAERRLASGDRYLLTAAAEHVASGRLVALTSLTAPHDPGRAAQQDITLVTREHRGHRLGTLVKAANLVQLAELAPEAPAVYTWNAEENRPMLDVNELLGFQTVGVEGQWERTTALNLD